jgi:hypothetical protein
VGKRAAAAAGRGGSLALTELHLHAVGGTGGRHGGERKVPGRRPRRQRRRPDRSGGRAVEAEERRSATAATTRRCRGAVGFACSGDLSIHRRRPCGEEDPPSLPPQLSG